MDAADAGYFRLNVWGMGRALDELVPLGVVTPMDHAPFKSLADFGVDGSAFYERWPEGIDYTEAEGFHYTGYVAGADDPFPTITVAESDLEPGVAAWARHNCAVIDGPGPGAYHGIPSYRFCSNDGWLVRPIEIQTGIGWADEHHEGWREGLTGYVAEFVDWMIVAAEHGGFRVH